MILKTSEGIEPQSGIKFWKMSDGSLMIDFPNKVRMYSLSDFKKNQAPEVSGLSNQEVIEAFERVEMNSIKKSRISTEFTGNN